MAQEVLKTVVGGVLIVVGALIAGLGGLEMSDAEKGDYATKLEGLLKIFGGVVLAAGGGYVFRDGRPQ